MLFSHHNGLSQPVTDDNVSQLQELACGIGPRIDGIVTSVMQPQSMGAFATQGAMNACMLRSQQAEQHQPTTTTVRGFGGGLGAESGLVLDTTPTKLALIKAASIPKMTAVMQVDTAAAGQQPVDPNSPSTPLPTTTSYPPGTITAFSSSTNMWRVAVPTVAAGLGMIGAAATYTEIAPVAAPPPEATQVSEARLEKETNQLPIWKKWQFWLAIGGGLAVVGTGTALLFRRKRAA